MRRSRVGWLCGAFAVSLVAALAFAALASPAGAITRGKANRIALRTLKPGKRVGRVVVFGLRRPLRRGSVVYGTSERRRRTVRRVRPLRRRAWLFWMDQAHGADFEHPSRLILVSNRSGRVIRRRRLRGFPLIGVRRPPFLRSQRAYYGRRYQIFSNVAAASPAAWRPRNTAVIAEDKPLAIKKEDLAKDCLVAVGPRRDPFFKPSLAAMEQWADDVKLEKYRAESSAKGLEETVDKAIKDQPCGDVFIYLTGHGRAPEGKNKFGPKVVKEEDGWPAGVLVAKKIVVTKPGGGGAAKIKERNSYITPGDIKRIIEKHKQTTFKVKVDACFSGRFGTVIGPENLRVLEHSSLENEASWTYLPEGKKLDPETGKEAEGPPIKNSDENKDKLSFTSRDVRGLYAWSRSAEEVQKSKRQLARGIARSFEIGRDSKFDFAEQLGYTHPQLYTNFK